MPLPNREHLARYVEAIPQSTISAPEESASPLLHFDRSVKDAEGLLNYFKNSAAGRRVQQPKYERHFARLCSVTIASMVQAFERYLKELAVVCVDHVAPFVLDDRFEVFRANPRSMVANFAEGSVGRAMCESDLWHNTDETTRRFRRILADPHTNGDFQLFQLQPNHTDFTFARAINTLFQLRHTVAHNVGTVTRSDAAKLTVLTRMKVAGERVLAPEHRHVFYVKSLLFATGTDINERVRDRLCALLTTLHAEDTSRFDPATTANAVASQFNLRALVAGSTGDPA